MALLGHSECAATTASWHASGALDMGPCSSSSSGQSVMSARKVGSEMQPWPAEKSRPAAARKRERVAGRGGCDERRAEIKKWRRGGEGATSAEQKV